MLAGSITNNKLTNSTINIAGSTISLGGSITADTLRTNLDLSTAMHFIGIATVAYTASNFPNISGYSTPTAGDVVIDKDKKYEYIYIDSTNKWELLGGDESYALSSAVINKSIITAKGDIIYGNASADPTVLSGNTTTTVKFLSMASSTPSWVTLQVSDIPSITKSKISDFSHDHGNMTNDGKIGSSANYAVYTTTGGTVTAGSFTTASPSASGTATSFITSVSQDSKGQITAAKASLPTASTTTAGIIQIGSGSSDAAAGNHNHNSTYVAKTDGVTAVSWVNSSRTLTRTVNGTAANVVSFLALGGLALSATTTSLTVDGSALQIEILRD